MTVTGVSPVGLYVIVTGVPHVTVAGMAHGTVIPSGARNLEFMPRGVW